MNSAGFEGDAPRTAPRPGTPGLSFPIPSPTNMVYLEVADARETAQRMAKHGVLVNTAGPTTIRTVFHLDISDAHVERAVDAFKKAL